MNHSKEDKTVKKLVLNNPFSLHVELDITAISESDGETFTVTQEAVVDQLKYVFERLQHKKVKIEYKMVVTPKGSEEKGDLE